MADYKQDLAAVGKKISALKSGSDAEMLQGLVGIGLNVMQNMYSDKQQEVRSDLTRSLSTLENSLKAIDYTQFEMEVEIDGKMVNLYDRQVELAEENLKNLSEISEDPTLAKHRDDIDLIRQHAVTKLAYQESMKDLREDSLDNLEDLGIKYMNLVKRDPSFTDPGTWSQGKDIYNHIEKAYAEFEYTFGKRMPAKQALLIQNVLQQYELDERNIMADADRQKPGFQTRLADKASPYLEDFFEKQGMKYVPPVGEDLEEENILEIVKDVESGQKTFMFPLEKDQKTIQLPDVDMYKSALTSFNQYQSIQTSVEAQNIILQQAAGEAHPFEVMRDWMGAPGDDYQLEAANAIAHQLFSDTTKPIESNLAGMDVGPYKDLIKTRYYELKELKDTGRHSAEFKNMQTTYNKTKKAKIKATGLTINQMSTENAASVRSTVADLNTKLATYNAQSRFKDKPSRQLSNIPNFVDKGQTTKLTKRYIVERLDLLLAEANDWEYSGNEPGADIKLIRDFENADGEAKWLQAQKLVNKYLEPKGFKAASYKSDINAAFDVGEWGEEERDLINVNTFYSLLQAFQAVSNADSAGTTEFEYLQSLLKPQ